MGDCTEFEEDTAVPCCDAGDGGPRNEAEAVALAALAPAAVTGL